MRLIVLDRDGVINIDREDYVKSPEELKFIPGSLDAMARLTQAGYDLVIATNQSGIGRGLYSREDVEAIHRRLIRHAARHGARISGIYVCPHAPLADCECRKPAPGLLKRIANDFTLDPAKLIMIGDTSKDMQAARAVGARPILVRTGQGETTLTADSKLENYADLAHAANALLKRKPRRLSRIIGSLAYNVGYVIAIIFFGFMCTLFSILPWGRPGLEFFARGYARVFFLLLRPTARLGMRMEGRENLPDGPCVLYLKHSSTWETFLPFILVRKPAFVLKRELLWIPLVGWPLARLGAVGINRRSHRRAIDQVLSQGERMLRRGRSIAIFPEGHRMPAGKSCRYGLSGAMLARHCNVPIVPIAHNSGDFWPRRAFLKHPGTVRVIIGPPIQPGERGPEAINLEAKAWIEDTMRTISIGYQAKIS
ncbi:MAG: D-glycero-beta-D-manno-heptose 1,7-bisphosphate 7-phosphatase [Gammaproteobacteria bacterium]